MRRSRSAFIASPRSTKKAPSKRGLQQTGATGVCVLPIWILQSAICNLTLCEQRLWAHQDLNLEPADYEPAALTIELWARLTSLQSAVCSRQSHCRLPTADCRLPT